MLATCYPICQLPARCVCGVAHVLAKAGLLSFNKMLRTIPLWCCHIFFRFLNILNSAKSCETRICNYCNYNMYTYCSDVIVCSLDNTSHGACPAMAGRHQELHHGTGAMATGPDWRRGQAPKAWRLTEVQRGIPEVFKLNLWITVWWKHIEIIWNILKNRFEMVWVWKLH